MTRNRNLSRYPIAVPVNGLDFRLPVFDMPPTYSPMSINFILDNGKARKRWGNTGTVDSSIFSIGVFGSDGTDNLWDHVTIDPSGNTVTAAGTVATPGTLPVYSDWTLFENIILVPDDSAGVVRALNPATPAWSSGHTFTNQVTGRRKPITSYRERVYVGDGKLLYYGAVGAAFGAMTSFDLTSLLNGEAISGLGVFSLSSGLGPNQYLVIVSDIGEILVYSGSYPGGSDWFLVSKYFLSFNFQQDVIGGGVIVPNTWQHNVEIIDVPGDLFISCRATSEVYSMRALMQSNDPYNSSITAPIRPLFKQLADNFYKTTTYVAEQNWLVMLFMIQTDSSLNPLLYDWFNDLGVIDANDQFNFIAVLDLDTGSIHFHTLSDSNTVQAIDGSMSATASNALYGGLTLFDQDSVTDPGSAAIEGVLVFPPFSGDYRSKTASQLITYSNLVTSHTLTVAVNRDFDLSPGSFSSVTTAETSENIVSKVVGASKMGESFVLQLKETSTHTTPFELQGVQLLAESGGEY